MYRISFTVIKFLLDYSIKPVLPEVTREARGPFTPAGTNYIGVIDPFCAMGTDFDYIVESSSPILLGAEDLPSTGITGYWLYKRGELKKPGEPVVIPRMSVDPNITSTDDSIDVTDCCVQVPSEIEKLTCPSIATIERLFELEPKIKECLKKA